MNIQHYLDKPDQVKGLSQLQRQQFSQHLEGYIYLEATDSTAMQKDAMQLLCLVESLQTTEYSENGSVITLSRVNCFSKDRYFDRIAALGYLEVRAFCSKKAIFVNQSELEIIIFEHGIVTLMSALTSSVFNNEIQTLLS